MEEFQLEEREERAEAVDSEGVPSVDLSGCKLKKGQMPRVKTLLKKYNNVFSKTPNDRGLKDLVEHRIDTGDARPIKQAARRQPFNYVRSRERRFKTYVANRVNEIRDSSTPELWHHVPGKLNPADLASRGQSVKSFKKSEQWFRGPDFLWQAEGCWPNAEVSALPEDDPEIKQKKLVGVIAVGERPPVVNGRPLVDRLIHRYFSWNKLLRLVAILRKFVGYLKDKSNVRREITTEELKGAELAVIKYVQGSEYAEEIADLQRCGRVKNTSPLKKLRPVLIDGILRVGGRLALAPISEDSKHPIILPKTNRVAEMLVLHFHQDTAHAGQEHVLARLHERFWIPKIRSKVRSMLRSCIGCPKRHAKKMIQVMAKLPDFRLAVYDPPFTRTGTDYFGPMLVKRGRSQVKRWGVLFTCLNTRAVHLEVAESLDTSSFLNALRRFTGRRGQPSDIWSDNGTNFVGRQRELKEALAEWNQHQIDRELLQKGIRWHFQPPVAPYHPGVWECLVRSVKLALTAILGQSLVVDEVLHTALVEVEATLNSRPLCKSSEDPSDDEVPTPNHFLMQRRAVALPPGEFHDTDQLHRKRWRQSQILANHFWKRFIKEYLATLQERSMWQFEQRNLKVRDLVLVADDDKTRGHWPMGLVSAVFPGDDGSVRVVEVKRGENHLKRPVHKLCLLEESD
ncbi:uncharacterized protein LOC135489981 [Lineus longissimus]|uniref:uncharacterized protein LOC135489981 n=1 Tax=Lineus longissimus TaxID=88925 RepID=UPI00315DF9F6